MTIVFVWNYLSWKYIHMNKCYKNCPIKLQQQSQAAILNFDLFSVLLNIIVT